MRAEGVHILPYGADRPWRQERGAGSASPTERGALSPQGERCSPAFLLLPSPLMWQRHSPEQILSYSFPSTTMYFHLGRCPEYAIMWGKNQSSRTVCLIQFCFFKSKHYQPQSALANLIYMSVYLEKHREIHSSINIGCMEAGVGLEIPHFTSHSSELPDMF